MHSPTAPREDWPDRLRLRAVEIGIAAVALFLLIRLISPMVTGASVVEGEEAVRAALREIHEAQGAALADENGRFFWLSELYDAAGEDSELASFERVDEPPGGGEVYRRGAWYLALFLVDPSRDDDRAWSPAHAGDAFDGQRGFGAYAWPVEYGDDAQWVFFIDQRGRLLGGFNPRHDYDGWDGAYPFATHPLREFLYAQKQDHDSEWFLFEDLPEIVLPGAASAQAADRS